MRKRIIVAALLLALGAAGAIGFESGSVFAQSGGAYDLTWNSIDSGGITFSTGGTYQLGGTIGQPDAATMRGGTYTLNGGFWVDFLGNHIQLPLIVR